MSTPTTIRVRIAVAVDPEGRFSIAGWKPTSPNYDNAAMESVRACRPGATGFYWVEADLPIPEVQTIQGICA